MSAEGLTLLQIATNVAVNLSDINADGSPAFVAWPQVLINGWVNAGYTEICTVLPGLLSRRVTFVINPQPVLPGNATAEYVPDQTQPGTLDFMGFLQAGVYKLYPKSIDELYAEYFDWETRVSAVPWWFNYNAWAQGVLKLVPDPGVALPVGSVHGIATLKPLLLGNCDVPAFDSEFHIALEFYATSRALMMGGDTQNLELAKMWMAMYGQKRDELRDKILRGSQEGSAHVQYHNV